MNELTKISGTICPVSSSVSSYTTVDRVYEVERGGERTPHQRPHAGDKLHDLRLGALCVLRAAEAGRCGGGAPSYCCAWRQVLLSVGVLQNDGWSGRREEGREGGKGKMPERRVRRKRGPTPSQEPVFA